MPTFTLVPHPDHSTTAVRSIAVEVARSIDWLHLRYRVDGDAEAIAWPAPSPREFRDGLWQHTCFEAFCRIDDRPSYREVNVAPSGAWAMYDFNGYRQGMTRAARRPLRHFATGELRLDAVIDIGRGEWQVGLAAVIEEVAGAKSYWALRHGPKKPDFHNPACFIATLPSPKRS